MKFTSGRATHNLKVDVLSRFLHEIVLKGDLSSVLRGKLEAVLKVQDSFKS